jgi:hypothetical protein
MRVHIPSAVYVVPLVRHASSPQKLKKKKRLQKGDGSSRMGICGACLLGHSYEELDTRIIHTIDSIRKLGVNIICRLGAEKKRERKKMFADFPPDIVGDAGMEK